ncbi:MAG: rhombosortase [Candidatus Acinetobacter avistercoris]|uniref:rhombosortase n=1 Tax=Acinetobacter sp. KS-LM10 TaxID=3120518 RepID=UPI001F91B4F7|nr:rhombosortase [Candidatus Acinetobacter avistercoris]
MQDQTLLKKILFIAICMSISASLQVFQHVFIYWRFSFFEEIWRWWTAHWVHVGWIHYFLNMIAFACLPFIFPHVKTRYLFILLLLLPPLISLSFYYYFSHIEAYAGLSGVLHGLYIAVALYFLKFSKERKFSLLVIVLISAKIIWENIFGSLEVSQLIGSTVLIEAHLLGLIWGAILALGYMSYEYFKTQASIKRTKEYE